MEDLLKLLASRAATMPVVDVRSMVRDADRITFGISIRDENEDNDFFARWTITGASPLDYRFVPGRGQLQVHGEAHSAVRQFLDPNVGLFFTMSGSGALAAAEALRAAHAKIAGEWIPFERYFNAGVPLAALLAKGGGKLASGPVFLMDAYAAAASAHGIAISRVGDGGPRVMNLPKIPGEDRYSLLVAGRSFVIARELHAVPAPT